MVEGKGVKITRFCVLVKNKWPDQYLYPHKIARYYLQKRYEHCIFAEMSRFVIYCIHVTKTLVRYTSLLQCLNESSPSQGQEAQTIS